MRVVVALGGNALLKRGEPLSVDTQRRNIQAAVAALAPLAGEHELVITHGNGPQVGLLAMQAAQVSAQGAEPLDVLDAESEGMIGYLIEQELRNALPEEGECATLLTQVEVDPADPAFDHPSKPIGPRYRLDEAKLLEQQRGWQMRETDGGYRRVVASPRPQRIFQLAVIEALVDRGVTVICAGGGGIPVCCDGQSSCRGVEAVIDKDLASALLARRLKADRLLMLTDVEAVYESWGEAASRRIRCISPSALKQYDFAEGSMGPKVRAAIEFAEMSGAEAAIGALGEAEALLAGEAGTRVSRACTETLWWEGN